MNDTFGVGPLRGLTPDVGPIHDTPPEHAARVRELIAGQPDAHLLADMLFGDTHEGLGHVKGTGRRAHQRRTQGLGARA